MSSTDKVQPLKVETETEITFHDELGKSIRAKLVEGKFSYLYLYFDGDGVSFRKMEDIKLIRDQLDRFLQYAEENNLN